MKAVIIGTSGHIDLALGVRDRATGVSFVGIAPGSADEDARSFFVDQLEASLIPWYDDWRSMLDRERPDLAVIAPFFHLQSAVARECLQRGIHAFVEKPMATSLEDLAALRAAHAAGRAKLCPMLAYRYHPEFQAAWLAVKEGLVGEPLALQAQKPYKLGTRHRMYTRRSTYGGTIPWVAVHAIDWLWWFTKGGLAEVVAAFGPGVCGINNVGCPATNCFCDAAHYWAYYDLDAATSQWVASAMGVGSVRASPARVKKSRAFWAQARAWGETRKTTAAARRINSGITGTISGACI